MSESRRLHVHVAGRVQGVAFRWNTVRAAERLGLCGWVRNLADGRVELVAEGDPTQLDALLGWVRHGPPGSRVDDVHFDFEPATGEFSRFAQIR